MLDHQDQAPEGPRLQDAAQPTRAQQARGWRRAALDQLEDLADLYEDLPEVRL